MKRTIQILRAFAYTTLIVFWFAVMGTAQEPAQKKAGKNLAQSTVPGVQPRTMPSVKGLTLEQAKALLATYGQERILPPIVGPSNYPEGQIFDQNPHPGDPLTPKTEITLYISNGTPPVASPTPSADISVNETLLNKRKEYWAGEQVQYTIVINNAGPLTATNVQVTTTPTNLANLTFDTKAGDCIDKTCTIKSLNVNSPATINLTATIATTGRFANLVRVEAIEYDPKQDDNTSADNAAQANASVDVSASQRLDPAGPYQPGQIVQYTITINNAGPSNATNIRIADKPVNLTINQVAEACTKFPCTIRNLAAGATATILVTASIDRAGPFEYGADLKLTEHDVNPDNNNIPTLGDVATVIPSPTPKFPPPWVWPILILVVGGFAGGGTYLIWRWIRPPPPPPIPTPVPPPPPTTPQVPPPPVVRGTVKFESSSSVIDGLKLKGPQIRLYTSLEMGRSIFDRPLPIIKREVIK